MVEGYKLTDANNNPRPDEGYLVKCSTGFCLLRSGDPLSRKGGMGGEDGSCGITLDSYDYIALK